MKARVRLQAEVASLRVVVSTLRMLLTMFRRDMYAGMTKDDAIKRVGSILRQLPQTLGQVPEQVPLVREDTSYPHQEKAPGWYVGGAPRETGPEWVSYCDGVREYIWQSGQTLDAIRKGLTAALVAPEFQVVPPLVLATKDAAPDDTTPVAVANEPLSDAIASQDRGMIITAKNNSAFTRDELIAALQKMPEHARILFEGNNVPSGYYCAIRAIELDDNAQVWLREGA